MSEVEDVNEQERRFSEREEQKKKIRARYKGVSRDELEFIPAKPKEKLFEDTAAKRVCAYCRVSTDDAKQTSSYELQKNHYEDMIREHPGWELVGIYADEGISGTSLLHRDDFNRMMEDCRAGKIDLIVTKSVSRFARNIVDCIAKQRELANLTPRVGVYFETEHIYSLDSTSEMMMAVLAAAAQEESHTKSEIMNISIEQRFSRGIFLTPELIGFDKDEDGNLVINEDEAETVKLIFYLFLNGFPTSEIAEILMGLGRETKLGRKKWSGGTVVGVLENERHCGDVLGRKTFTPNYLDHKSKKNRQDRNQYKQSGHHEAIVSHEVFDAAQKLLAAYRYRKRGFPLPSMQVVDDGALRGFVPVNRSWPGFTEDDFRKASESAYDGIYQTAPGDGETFGIETKFDLSGFEIARAQFFSTRLDPAMTISNGKLSFNTACLKKFEDAEYVELLFNPVGKCIAVRPCSENNVNAIKWGSLKNGRWMVLPKSCRGFAKPLYGLMDWDESRGYRFRGQYHEQGDEQIMLFDLVQPEILVTETESAEPESKSDETAEAGAENARHTEDIQADGNESNGAESFFGNSLLQPDGQKGCAGKKKRKTVYPDTWAYGFGDKAENDRIIILQRIKYHGNWDILRPARTVEGIQIITPDVLEELMDEAKNMMEKMRALA